MSEKLSNRMRRIVGMEEDGARVEVGGLIPWWADEVVTLEAGLEAMERDLRYEKYMRNQAEQGEGKLKAKLEAMEKMESILASLADCLNLELRESGRFDMQIEDYLTTDMRPFIRSLVDANRKRAAQEEQGE